MKPTFKKLKNGLRIIVVPMPQNKTVTVLTLVQAGSKYETKKISGLSHFLEHMCFKGTTKRPTAMDISYELDSLGAQSNAFTGHEYTGYYAKGDVKHFPKLLDIVSDIYLNSTFPEPEMEKEKGVIVEEINMYNDLPDEIVDDNLAKLLYGDQPAGWNVAGDIPTVKSMTRKDFIDYRKNHYVASSTIVVVSGGVTKAVAKDIERAFKGVLEHAKSGKKKVAEKQSNAQLITLEKKTQQTHVAFGFRGFDMYDDHELEASLLAVVLGSGMSSRLFHKLRTELGVCYYAYSLHRAFTDHGIFKIAAGVTNARLLEVIEEILKECKRLKTELIPEDELKKAKDMIRGRTLLGLESSDAWAMYYGGLAVSNKSLESVESHLKRIEKISAKDLQEVAKKMFVDKKMNVSVVGPKLDNGKIKEKLKV